MSTVGERIKQVRDWRGLTQAAFAQALNVSDGYITSLESGKRKASARLLQSISDVAHVNHEWLLTGDGKMQRSDAHALPELAMAYEHQLARDFLEIQKALAPSCERTDQIVAIFKNQVSNDMINFLASRFANPEADAHEPDRMDALFRVAFPDYKQVVQNLRENARDRIALMNQSHFAHMVNAPVAGFAAAGIPLNDTAVDSTVAIPRKYLDPRFFVIQARGDSMSPRINDGDFVIAEKDTAPVPGGLALVAIEGAGWEYAIKLLSIDTGSSIATLRSYNADYPPIFYPCSQIAKAERIVHVVHNNKQNV